MEFNSGDKITFGPIYCHKTGRKELLNKTIMITPQTFEHYNGIYTEDEECPGIHIEDYGEPDSIYHLFGNDLGEFYDCKLIKATEEDIKMIADKQQEIEELIAKDMGDMADFVIKNIRKRRGKSENYIELKEDFYGATIRNNNIRV